ncbi:MAG: divergent polysaccharide deacetylase family protein [Fibrobacter sp.]|nr:divergent polysaccharide deacetylase family protein [Fibrobacter sp.]
MKNLKHIIAIIIVLSILGIVLQLIPKFFSGEKIQDVEQPEKEVTANVDSTLSVTPPEDTASFETKFKNELEVIQESRKKSRPRVYWTLGRGKTIIVYLMQAKHFIEKNGGTVLSMEELHDPKYFQSANLDLIKPDGDSLKLQLQVSDNIFRSDASALSISFQVTNLNPEIIAALNKLDFPYDLLVPPFGLKDAVYADLDKVRKKEIILWMTMESTALNKSHNKYRPLRVHHTEEQLETIIDDSRKKYPNAKGIATKHGKQAMEHTQLLKAILKPAEKNKLWFLDITENKQSIILDVCKGMDILCKKAPPYNPEHSSLQDYVNAKRREASKSGLSAMILPLNMESLKLVEELSQKLEKQGTSLINLSTFMSYQ